jgi:hypothetical protein
MSLREPCWQCELDIAHICYAGMPNARWGMTDEAVAALEGAQRLGYMLPAAEAALRRKQQRQEQQHRRATSKKRRAL